MFSGELSKFPNDRVIGQVTPAKFSLKTWPGVKRVIFPDFGFIRFVGENSFKTVMESAWLGRPKEIVRYSAVLALAFSFHE
jgi:hypothetical protein